MTTAVHLKGSLFRRYAIYLASLVSLALLVSGGIGAWFSYQDARALVDELQREKARAAAARIAQFIQAAELQLKGAVVSGRSGGPADTEARHIELLRLLRIAPSVSDAASIDGNGRERVRVSRVERDTLGSEVDRSADPAVLAAGSGRTWYGGIRFHRQSEPQFEMAVSGNRPGDGVVIAGINLKFASDVVADIRMGDAGKAYVVAQNGDLIVHQDTGMALRRINLAHLPQVRAALGLPGAASAASAPASTAATADLKPVLVEGIDGRPATIATHATIAPTGWKVIVEQPLSEAFAPMVSSLARTAALSVAGMGLAVIASLLLARRMTAPIRLLEDGARRIGDGHLNDRVDVRSGDELEALADQFNRMAGKLRESHAGLEEKVEQRTRQLAEANRAKARFLAAASHDLRQPVHALGLFVAQLEGAGSEHARTQLIGKVAASSAAVSELIEALLDISKLDAGAVTPQPAVFALQPLFDRIEHALAPAAAEKGLRLRMRPTALWVGTDPMLLERILLNLCGNAIRHTDQGGAIVAARSRGALASIEVWDTGIGITAEQRGHIFDEFYQASGTSVGQHSGLGLGLAIVDRLAGLLGLTISVRSVPARGSVFAVSVPLARPAATDTHSVLSQLLAPARFEGLPILLVDDDESARDAVGGLLTQWGCHVRPAAGSADAAECLKAGARPQLIICDYHLAGGELGIEAIRLLRALANADIPAVILSGDAATELRAAAAAEGLHLLHKPLNPARLRALLLHVTGTVQPVRDEG